MSALVSADSCSPSMLAEADASPGGLEAKTTTRRLLYMFGEWAQVFVICGMVSALFLGGWQLPGVHFESARQVLALRLVSALLFLLKSWALVFLVVWLRHALPRLGSRERARVSLRWIVPMSLVSLALAVGFGEVLPLLGLGRNASLVIAAVTFVAWSLGAGIFAWRVKLEATEARSPLHLNPII